jgi:hypothetical protein
MIRVRRITHATFETSALDAQVLRLTLVERDGDTAYFSTVVDHHTVVLRKGAEPTRITDTLKKVEAAGFDEVILYFNVGLKPHNRVKEEMDRFMHEVAPAFATTRARRSG